MKNKRIKCETKKAVKDREEKQQLSDIYLLCYAGISGECAQEQRCYTKEGFLEALEDAEYLKFIARGKDGKPVGLALATNNLDKASVAYIDPVTFRRAFPEQSKQNKIYYFTFLGVLPENQRTIVFGRLLEHMIIHMDREKAIPAFDYAKETNGDLPENIERAYARLINKGKIEAKGVERKMIGQQVFECFKVSY